MKHRNGSRFISAKANRRPRPGAFVAATIAIAFASVVAMAGPASATSTPGSLSFIAGDAVNFFAGDPTAGPALNTPLYKPEGIAFDSSGDLYIADFYASAIEKVTPSGTLSIFAGIPGNSGYPTPGPATSAQFERPNGIAVDPSGNVYVADESANVVVMITPTGTLSIVAGTAGQSGNPTPGPAASSLLNEPDGLSFDAAGNLYIADRGNSVVEKVTPTGTLSIFAGVINHYGTPTAGPATSSYLNSPYDITFDKAGDAYISDQLNNVIEKVTPQGTLSVIAGIVGSSAAPTAGPALDSSMNDPSQLAIDSSGNLYVADEGNQVIEKVTPSGVLSFVAGTGTYGTPTAGPALASNLASPAGIAFDHAGNLYIADSRNAVIEQDYAVSTPTSPMPGSPSLAGPNVVFPWSGVPGVASYTVTVYVNGAAQTPVAGLTGLSYSLPNVPGDTFYFTVSAANAVGTGPASADSTSITTPTPTPTPGSAGYWTVGGDGGVFSFGPTFYGSTGNLKLNQPVFAITSTSDGHGYWFVARDGGVFTYGDGVFHGSVPALGIHVSDIVGMAADTTTGGYWLVGADGGVYAFDAPFDGSVPGLGQHLSNIVGVAATPDGGGYYLVSSTGAVYAFGDAKYQGGANTLARINAPIVGITVDSATGGYWEAGSDGGIYAYGAPFHGSAGGSRLNQPVVGIAATTDGSGYYLAASDGGVFSYNAPFLGSMGGKDLNAPMVGIAVEG